MRIRTRNTRRKNKTLKPMFLRVLGQYLRGVIEVLPSANVMNMPIGEFCWCNRTIAYASQDDLGVKFVEAAKRAVWRRPDTEE